jgi:hypothetical protein
LLPPAEACLGAEREEQFAHDLTGIKLDCLRVVLNVSDINYTRQVSSIALSTIYLGYGFRFTDLNISFKDFENLKYSLQLKSFVMGSASNSVFDYFTVYKLPRLRYVRAVAWVIVVDPCKLDVQYPSLTLSLHSASTSANMPPGCKS